MQYNNIARREKKYADYLYMGWAREDCSYTGCTKILGPIIVIISLSLCVLGMVWFFCWVDTLPEEAKYLVTATMPLHLLVIVCISCGLYLLFYKVISYCLFRKLDKWYDILSQTDNLLQGYTETENSEIAKLYQHGIDTVSKLFPKGITQDKYTSIFKELFDTLRYEEYTLAYTTVRISNAKEYIGDETVISDLLAKEEESKKSINKLENKIKMMDKEISTMLAKRVVSTSFPKEDLSFSKAISNDLTTVTDEAQRCIEQLEHYTV